MQLDCAALTDLGNRAVNEDCYACIVGPDGWLFAVADGLGGHGRGDEAAQLVVRSVAEGFLRAGKGKNAAQLQSELFLGAQQALLALQREADCAEGMRTTLNLVLVCGGVMFSAHIGDGRTYLFREKQQIFRTQDHSIVQLKVDMGEISQDEARHHPQRNQLLRVMGVEWGRANFEVSAPMQLQKGDALLLCTDGFWELVEEKSMLRALKKRAGAKAWLAGMDRCVLKAGRGRKMDNRTAVAVVVGDI